MATNNIVLDKSFDFALLTIKLCRHLRTQKEYDLAHQLIRAGTSVGANIEEGCAGVSKPDFINKMGLALKESRESRYWLRLLDASDLLPEMYRPMKQQSTELVALLTAIIKKAKSNNNRGGI